MCINNTKGHDRTLYPVSPIPAVAVVVTRGDKVLLIKRGKEPRKGTWTVPGGSVELGETLAEAAAREVREETGINIEAGRPFTAIDAIYHDQEGGLKFHYVIIYMEASYLNGKPEASDDAQEARWVDFKTLRQGFPHAEKRTLSIIRERLGI